MNARRRTSIRTGGNRTLTDTSASHFRQYEQVRNVLPITVADIGLRHQSLSSVFTIGLPISVFAINALRHRTKRTTVPAGESNRPDADQAAKPEKRAAQSSASEDGAEDDDIVTVAIPRESYPLS